MNASIYCCCTTTPVLPCLCGSPVGPFGKVRFFISGVNATNCTVCENSTTFSDLAVDGTWDVQLITNALASETQFPGFATVVQHNFTNGACTTEIGTCEGDRIFFQVQFDCLNLNADGQPKILNISVIVRGPVNDCDTTNGPGTIIAYAFWYDVTSHGGTYYNGDTVPNKIVTCGSAPAATAATGGTVRISCAP